VIKSVITAAGRGVRLLPFTKEMPKEMMPLFCKNDGQRAVVPMLQIIFEKLYDVNIRDYCFVVGREKRSIEDHFTPDYGYLRELSGRNKELITTFYKKLEKSHLIWVNQNKPMGFGDSVRKTEKYVGHDDFVVHAGDVTIMGGVNYPIKRLIDTAQKDPSISAVLLCKKVKDPRRYGVPSIVKISKSLFAVEGVEEKPEKPKSNFGILPLYYFKPRIFDCLKKIKRGRGNEFQLTDAIQRLIDEGEKVVSITLNSNEFEVDVGTVESYKIAQDITYRIG
jgi:UTP--glucose-1-phosphate uridylyltransferase